METKFGFVPGGSEPTASRLRRKFRLLSGGNPTIFLIHYTRGPTTRTPVPLISISQNGRLLTCAQRFHHMR
jgi:hypothetical protein